MEKAIKNKRLEAQGEAFLILVVILYTLVLPVSAWTVQTLANASNDNLTSEILTFTGAQNITRYLVIPYETTFIHNFQDFNVSEWNAGIYTCFQESANQTNQTGLDTCVFDYSGKYAYSGWSDLGTNPGRIIDGDYGTFGADTSITSSVYYVNYTKFSGNPLPAWKVAVANSSNQKINFSITIPMNCRDYSETQINLKVNNSGNSALFEFWCQNSSTTWTNVLNYNSGAGMYFFEESMFWIGLFSDFKLYVGDGEWEVYDSAGVFTDSVNIRTIWQTIFDNQLPVCSNVSGYCYIPFIFSANTPGSINYSDIYFTNQYENINSITSNFSDYVTNTKRVYVNLSYDPNEYEKIVVSFYSQLKNDTSPFPLDYVFESQGTTGTEYFYADYDLPATPGDYGFYYWIDYYVNSSWIIASTIFIGNDSDIWLFNANLSDINFGQCNSTIPTRTLNFTAYNQDTLNRVNPFDFKGTFNYFLGNGTTYKTISMENLSVAEKTLCIDTNLTYKINGNIEYKNTSYMTGNFLFNRYNIDNITQNISLYFMNGSLATSFIILVQNQNQQPMSNYFVYIYRYNPATNTYYLVQNLETDSAGKGIGFFETETIDYKFIITDPFGNIVLETNKNKIIPETTPYTLIFTIGTPIISPFDYYANIEGLTYTLAWNKNTKIASLVYADSNAQFSLMELIVRSQNYSGINAIVCNISSTDAISALSCDLSNNSSGSYVAEAYLTRTSRQKVNAINFDIFGYDAGMLGIFGGFLIILICAFVFVWNEVAGIVMINLGVIAINILGLVNFGIVGISAVIGISVLILMTLERG